MKKLKLLMHTSLDGFVNDKDGGMGWVKLDDSMFEFIGTKFINEIGTALYGKVTYGMMEGYWPTAGDQPNASKHTKRHSAWYMNVDKIVLSTTLKTDNEKVTVIESNLAERIKEEKNKPGKDILIFGSPSAAHSLLEHDLIDGFWLFVNPILVGKGVQLFDKVPQIEKLKLVSTEKFESGVLFLNYERERDGN
jgi:dihydrofolate reductase